MRIGERVFDLLAQSKRTQRELADHLDIAFSTVNGWRQPNRNPSSEIIVPICEFFGVDEHYLLTGERLQADNAIDDDLKGLIADYINLDNRGKTLVRATAYQELDRMEAKVPEVYIAARDGGGFERIQDPEQARIASNIIDSHKKSKHKIP